MARPRDIHERVMRADQDARLRCQRSWKARASAHGHPHMRAASPELRQSVARTPLGHLFSVFPSGHHRVKISKRLVLRPPQWPTLARSRHRSRHPRQSTKGAKPIRAIKQKPTQSNKAQTENERRKAAEGGGKAAEGGKCVRLCCRVVCLSYVSSFAIFGLLHAAPKTRVRAHEPLGELSRCQTRSRPLA